MPVPRLLNAASEWLIATARRLDLGKRHRRDALAIFAASVTVFAFSAWVDLFEKIYVFAKAHEDWEVDEVFMLSLVLSVGMIIVGYRRIQDLNREISARHIAESEAETLARHDPLTGLLNRRSFTEGLERTLDQLLVSGQR